MDELCVGLVQKYTETWRGEISSALEEQHEAGRQALGGVQVQRRREVPGAPGGGAPRYWSCPSGGA
jgi:hypothetical protein